jgi:hypothetical protein
MDVDAVIKVCLAALHFTSLCPLPVLIIVLLQGQKACNDQGTLSQATSFVCINPFYAEPLCVSACIITSLFTTAAAWLVKDSSDEKPREGSNYSSTNTQVCRRSRRHPLCHILRSIATGRVSELQLPSIGVSQGASALNRACKFAAMCFWH